MGRDYWEDWRPGILSGNQIKTLIYENIIESKKRKIGHAALDLTLSDEIWITNGSLKLIKGELLSKFLDNPIYAKKLSFKRKRILYTGKTYVVKLNEKINKSSEKLALCGTATGKSTIGRLDVLTRLIVDGCEVYDWIPEVTEWNGLKSLNLYVEIAPITIPIKVKEGIPLNQIRLFRCKPKENEIKSDDLKKLFKNVIFSDLEDYRDLSLNLLNDEDCNIEVCAFTTKATNNKPFTTKECIDLTKPNKYYNPINYWKPIPSNEYDNLLIKPEEFYILRSKERFILPPNIGVYCEAVKENLGELRIHYAGFVHPEFGKRKDNKGAPLIFEVRGHSINTYLRHGEIMARLKYYWMSEPAYDDKGSYSDQELTLSKYFDMEKYK